jgi:4'-phosphopantetheinyl transferase
VELPADTVHVWAVDLARGDDECNELAGVLSEDELRRCANMRVDAARRRFIISRAALRLLLARYLGERPEEVSFVFGDHGKPALRAAPLRFNLSHSGELCLIAATSERDVGVDVERTRRRRDPLRIARRYFTAAENDAIERSPDPTASFYVHWVAKEALLKATGVGLAGELDSFEVAVEPVPRIVHIGGDPDEGARWSLELLALPGGYAAALVTAGRLRRPGLRQFDPAAVSGSRWS